jgi:hypothetical protein
MIILVPFNLKHSLSSSNSWSIIASNVASALLSLKGMTVGSRNPYLVLKAAFMNVFFLNADIVISPLDIEFGEDPSVFYLCDKFWNEWQQISVFDSVVIELAIIYHWSKFPIFLFDKEE